MGNKSGPPDDWTNYDAVVKWAKENTNWSDGYSAEEAWKGKEKAGREEPVEETPRRGFFSRLAGEPISADAWEAREALLKHGVSYEEFPYWQKEQGTAGNKRHWWSGAGDYADDSSYSYYADPEPYVDDGYWIKNGARAPRGYKSTTYVYYEHQPTSHSGGGLFSGGGCLVWLLLVLGLLVVAYWN